MQHQSSTEDALAETEWLIGGGEMGELVRALDWAATPLGARAAWPLSLRTVVNLVLAGRFPMAILWGSELCLVYNDAFRVIAGAQHPAALGSSIRQVWECHRPFFLKLLAHGKTVHLVDQVIPITRATQSEEAYFTVSCSPVYIEDGQLGGTLATLVETTQRILAERQRETDKSKRQRAEAALHASEQQLREVLENSLDASYKRDLRTYTFEYVSPVCMRISGYTPDEMRALSLEAFLALVHPDDLNANTAVMAELFSAAVHPSYQLVYRFKHKDGQYRWVLDQFSILRDAQGQPEAVIGSVSDITAYKLLEEELRAADRAKDEFLAVLSHELQTPLTNMLGWSAEALRAGTPELMTSAMEIVHRNAVRQKRLVADILDMSRLIHRKVELTLEPTDLWTQASQAVENVQHVANERQQRLKLHPQADPLPIHADPARLQQCLANLLNNSLKFTPAGGAITVACLRTGAQAALSVTDTGCGIDPAALPKLFQTFYQVDRDEQHGGLGLGLAISRGLIQLHGGDMTADSPGKDQGTTVTITLPIANAPADTMAAD